MSFPPVRLITPSRHGDARGWFSETYVEPRYVELGIGIRFVQDNHAYSASVNTLRGLHFQVPPHSQAKLVRCVRGRVYDVAVDLRRGAPTYGRWTGAELSADNGRQLFLPEGFAHGVLTLEPDSEVIYKVSDVYAPACDRGIRWDSVGITWPLVEGLPLVLSLKDEQLPRLADFDSPFVYDGNPLQSLED